LIEGDGESSSIEKKNKRDTEGVCSDVISEEWNE
jgi:hypothetical protein